MKQHSINIPKNAFTMQLLERCFNFVRLLKLLGAGFADLAQMNMFSDFNFNLQHSCSSDVHYKKLKEFITQLTLPLSPCLYHFAYFTLLLPQEISAAFG